jgi:hypothetical protein
MEQRAKSKRILTPGSLLSAVFKGGGKHGRLKD